MCGSGKCNRGRYGGERVIVKVGCGGGDGDRVHVVVVECGGGVEMELWW